MAALRTMADQVRNGEALPPSDVEQIMHVLAEPEAARTDNGAEPTPPDDAPLIEAGRRQIRGKSPNQRRYLHMMHKRTLTLAIGPAGSGKTWLAVASAVSDLLSEKVARIVLTRPAIEAGERLGFLPGDMAQKVDPYLRPLYDALHDCLPAEQVERRIALLQCRAVRPAEAVRPMAGRSHQGEADRHPAEGVR